MTTPPSAYHDPSAAEEHFWTSADGQVLSQDGHDAQGRLCITMIFHPRSRQEGDFMRARSRQLRFTERSTLARIGIDIIEEPEPRPAGQGDSDDGSLVLSAVAFVVDPVFPTAPHLAGLLRPGVPVGRLFFAPEGQKLSSAEITRALAENRLKLPDTISVDQQGCVWLTPHKVVYTLPRNLSFTDLERLVRGHHTRTFLNSKQIREDAAPVTIGPRCGILTSCSMYLQEHYVVLTRGDGKFGLHTAAVLLDPVKTFGSDIMLEIYNTSDRAVINPMVSVEIYRAPASADPDFPTLRLNREHALDGLSIIYEKMDADPAAAASKENRPLTSVSLDGQHALAENESLTLKLSGDIRAQLADPARAARPIHGTVLDALAAMRPEDDTLVVDYLPNFFEHVEVLSRIRTLPLRQIVFRKGSRDHDFFLSDRTHARLADYDKLGVKVHWRSDNPRDLYTHTYKKNHGFWVRQEMIKKFQTSTIFAMYGSAVDIPPQEAVAINTLINKLIGFFGTSIGFMTGGGGGVMSAATASARDRGCLTGACFLELEAQPPGVGVDFFNTFQETSRHNRQKWFEVANFCIFNVGGLGTLEEIGIEMCNLKLGMRPRAPYIFFGSRYWRHLQRQMDIMVKQGRAPRWVRDYALFTSDPDEVVSFYRQKLEVV